MKKLLSIILFLSFLMGGVSSSTFKRDKNTPINRNDNEDELVIKVPSFKSFGDCTLLQLGNCDILIDCGAKDSEAPEKINKLLENNIKDNTLDYAIITHQDEDHLSAFSIPGVGVPGWLNANPKRTIGTLIDFDIKNDPTTMPSNGGKFVRRSSSMLYSASAIGYIAIRKTLIASKKIVNYYPASLCTIEKRIKDENIDEKSLSLISGLSHDDTFILDSGNGNKGELKILYNKYLVENDVDFLTEKKVNSNHSLVVNQMSVCSLITYGTDKFLFTGDLMEYFPGGNNRRVFGETELIKNNYDDLKDGVLFYRGGHHGSRSSSSAYFMSIIRPQYVCWSGIAGRSAGSKGTDIYPTQQAIRNVSRYTDKIYYTSCSNKYHGGKDDNIDELYGDIEFTYNPKGINNNKMSVKYTNLSEPDSFFLTSYLQKEQSRDIPIYIYNLTGNVPANNPVDCSYVKIGHIDILIGAGHFNQVVPSSYKKEIVNKIKYLCNDKVLDYVIIPTTNHQSYGFLIGNDGLFNNSNYYIKNLLYKDLGDEETNRLVESIKDRSNINQEGITKVEDSGHNIPLSLDEKSNIDQPFLRILSYPYSTSKGLSQSIMCVVSAFGFNYLNLGHNVSYSDDIITSNPWLENSIDAIQIPHYGYLETDSLSFYSFIRKIASTASTHSYAGYASNAESEKTLDGIVALFNTTFSLNDNLPSKSFMIRGDGNQALTYKKSTNTHNLLSFSTLYTKKNNSTAPFNEMYSNRIKQGDLCLRAYINAYMKRITYGVDGNYSDDTSKLLFSQCNKETDTFKDENASAKAETFKNYFYKLINNQ